MIALRLTQRFSISINGATSLRVRCWCGRWVDGDPKLVEEAHRQHVTRHRPVDGRSPSQVYDNAEKLPASPEERA